MRVAICQLNIKFEDKQHNWVSVKEMICKSAKLGADVIFFPEMTLTGFSMNVQLIGETMNETVELMKEIAVQNNITIGFGWVKRIGNKGENHYTVVYKNKEVIADYVKIHPFSYSDEDKHYIPGNRLAMFSLASIRIALFICYDLRFPEIFQAASEKADVLVVAANWPERRIKHWNKLIEARAIENQCYVLGINCFGEQQGLFYNGSSKIVLPTGEVHSCIENEQGLLLCDIEDEAMQLRAAFPMKKDRKKQLYIKLLNTADE